MQVQVASHVRAAVRQRSAFLLEHGYHLRRADGAWEHATGDVILAEKIATIRDRDWPALREWIMRQVDL